MVIIDAAMFAKPTLMIHNWISCGDAVLPRHFPKALHRLMSNVNYRRNLGIRSCEYSKAHYSRKMILDRWERLLLKTMT